MSDNKDRPNKQRSVKGHPATAGLFIGTSGYVFPDWSKSFYPKGLDRSLYLRYYLQYFNALELNTTFYAIPPMQRMAQMADKLPSNFKLHIKLPRMITHRRDISPSEIVKIIRNFSDSISPLIEKGIVKGYLAQFPVSFRFNDENYILLLRLIESAPKPLFVEFRSADWRKERVQKIFTENKIGWVVPDAPRLERLMPNDALSTSDTGYIRLHGRNSENWYAKDKDRYDYSYSNDELDEIFGIAKKIFHRGAKKVFVYFNNCHRGQAAINAKKFAELIGILPTEKKLL